MRGVRSVHQVSLSIAGILALVLIVVPAFVPQELRADAASRLAGLVQYFDATFSDVWNSAIAAQGKDRRAGVSTSHKSSGPHSGASPVLTGGDAEAAREGLIDINGLGLDSFNAAYGAGSKPIDGLLRDLIKDNNLGTSADFEAFVGSSGGGNARAGFGGDGDHFSGGSGASTGGAALAGPSRPSSGNGGPAGSAASRSKNSEGTLRLTDVKPDAHQDRVTGLGNNSVPVYNDAGASREQVASGQSNGHFNNEPAGSDGNGGGPGHALDSTNGDVVGQLPNGLDNPFQGDDHPGPVFQNEGNGGADSSGGNGHNGSDHDLHAEDHGPSNNTVVTGSDSSPLPDSGPLSGVPEPRSLTLLSLGLGAIVLRGKFRSAR